MGPRRGPIPRLPIPQVVRARRRPVSVGSDVGGFPDAPGARPSVSRRVSAFFFRHPRVRLAVMLGPGLAWLGVLYLGSLGALLVQSFYRLEEFTGLMVREFGLATYRVLFDRANVDIILRTTAMAAAVTLACAVIAFPLAYFTARYASSRMKALLYLGVVMPLWSAYLVRVYSWKLILAKEGVFNWFVERIGLDGVLDALLRLPGIGGPSLSQSYLGMFIVFVYIWLPYMILPLMAALERVPATLLEASGDLGARPGRTFHRVILPLALPGVIAGSIFTFSLTLGDFIIPTIIGDSSFFIGAAVYVQQGTAGNLPLAAALAVVPLAIMAVYLVLAKRAGAFEAL
ncbi:MAG: ABC transporter permease [Actinobacteria bacterium]|nr:ABC transporter permease [Actinomycetota bacterium]